MKLIELVDQDNRPVTQRELKELESFLDSLFKVLHIDISWTRHFLDRINDPRNKQQITIEEIKKIFQEVFKKHAKEISKQGPDFEGILDDITSNINIPFILVWDKTNQELDMVSKTIMRKKDFKSADKKFIVKT